MNTQSDIPNQTMEFDLDVLALVPDLFFASRIDAVATSMGKSLLVVRSQSDFDRALDEHHPRLILIDLGARGIDAESAIHAGKRFGTARLMVFGPHLDVSARAAALGAGADHWVTNQRLVETLAAELRGERGNTHSEE